MWAASVDHRFDGEEHAGFQFWPRSGARRMDHFRRIMEQPAKAVTAELLHDAITELARMFLDCRPDIAKACARFRRSIDPQHQAFIGHIDQLARLERRFAGKIHPACIAMPAIQQWRDVDVDDVAVLESLVGRYAMTDHMIDRRAAAMRITAITHGCRHSTCIQHHGARLVVYLAGRHTWLDESGQLIENFRRKTPCLAHAFIPVRTMQLDCPIAIDGLVRLDYLIFRHAVHIVSSGRNCEMPIGER